MRGYRNQRGVGLVEAMIVLIIAAIAFGSAAQQYSKYLDNITNKQAADHATLIAAAASKYLKDNYAAVLALAGPTTPAVITVAMLKTTNYLPAGISDKNAFGQTYNIQVVEPIPNQLQAMVVTSGGQTISELDGRRIAQYMGAKGGFISIVDTTVATGSFGGWQMALSPFGISPGAGHVATALFLEDGAVVNDYLYRNAVPGHPELNRMNTAINMNGNNVNNAGTVAATAVTTTTLTASGDITAANATVEGDTTTGGTFRSTGDAGWYNQKWNGGWYMNDPNWVRSYGNKGVYTGGEVHAGKVTSEGRVEVGEYLQLNAIAQVDTACSPNGLLGRNSLGATLSCQSGFWKGGSGKLGASWSQHNYPGQGWVPMNCPEGYVMTGIVAPMEDHKIITCRQLN
ncbi:shufflon system plasmid conjugative transfer pilus tip adhesin PilV [Pseudomonas reactans]|nr:shufflon system plasmid conjugative transfer pilus tip adhesin PilV [Pseudomonas reactans]